MNTALRPKVTMSIPCFSYRITEKTSNVLVRRVYREIYFLKPQPFYCIEVTNHEPTPINLLRWCKYSEAEIHYERGRRLLIERNKMRHFNGWKYLFSYYMWVPDWVSISRKQTCGKLLLLFYILQWRIQIYFSTGWATFKCQHVSSRLDNSRTLRPKRIIRKMRRRVEYCPG